MDIEHLLTRHTTLCIQSIENIFQQYNSLSQLPVRVYIERNTSHAHAALMANQISAHFSRKGQVVIFEKETGCDGQAKIGIWTRNKANLVHLAQLLLSNKLVALDRRIVTVSKCMTNTGDSIDLSRNQTENDEHVIVETLLSQLRNFKRSIKIGGKTTLTGKRDQTRDDLAMAFILFLAWTCFIRED